ncbi:hypothetical protein evm_014560 [Chilo suppressalis]|nr:hypothetical protein evm_014560 [Chilo suppressalis]
MSFVSVFLMSLTLCLASAEYVLDARTGSCYKFHTAGRTWIRAYKTCREEGGYLAIINDDTEVQVIKDVFAKHPSEKIASNYKDVAYIGFCSWGDHDNWYTVHGQTLEEAGYSRWAPGEPNNQHAPGWAGENCGSILRYTKPGAGMLNDVPCNITLAFICEMKPGSQLCDGNYMTK